MRKLNGKQKQYLDIFFNENIKELQFISIGELTLGVYNAIKKINDYETLYQDVDRYLMDKTMESRSLMTSRY